jgi:hypothetical protein
MIVAHVLANKGGYLGRVAQIFPSEVSG